jgi:acetyl esterase
VGGDSAGGHLATVTARRLRDLDRRTGSEGTRLPDLAAQVLVYPVTDLVGGHGEHPSRSENATGYLLTSETVDFFADAYVPDRSARSDPDASPLLAEDLTGLPPALVVVAGYDPLRDEGLAYASRLSAAGVATIVDRVDSGVHLCLQMPTTAIGRELVERIARFTEEQLGT